MEVRFHLSSILAKYTPIIPYLCAAMEEVKNDIRKFSEEEMVAEFAKMGEPKFRAKQVHEWLWKKSARTFDEMTNLSKD
ncbi:MAG TPA: hypothetical protein VK174_13830, partial [Chitinophagales bacterium]|nr:hypothetical protein [Chitinophagales bacterium]